ELSSNGLVRVTHLWFGIQAEALDAFSAQLELQSPEVQRGIEALAVARGEQHGIPLLLALLHLNTLVIDTCPYRRLADIKAGDLAIDAVPVHVGMDALDEVALVTACRKVGMPAPLPVDVEVQAGAARGVHGPRLGCPRLILVGEQRRADEGTRCLAGRQLAAFMGVQPKGTHLDVDRWTIGHTSQQLDGELRRLQQEAVAAACACRVNLRAQPVG